MEVRAELPAIPGRRSEQTVARVARNIGPIFGVPSRDAPGGFWSWACDYSRVTLQDLMRGAPGTTSQLPRDITADRGVAVAGNSIANATAARFGPDTKAALVLTGTNALLEPIADALCAAFARHNVSDPALLIGAYAFCVLEIFRSEPLLLLAAMQAQGHQRAATMVDIPITRNGLTSFASHEWGWPKTENADGFSPVDVNVIERLSKTLCDKVEPAPVPHDYVLTLGGSPTDRLQRKLSGMTTATLLDVSSRATDAGLRLVDTPTGRRADLLFSIEQRIRRFAEAIAPHVKDCRLYRKSESDQDHSDDEFAQISGLALPKLTGDELRQRADLTVWRALFGARMALFHTRIEPLRHRLAQRLQEYAEAVEAVVGPAHPEALLARLESLADLIGYPSDNPGHGCWEPAVVKARAQWIKSALDIAEKLVPTSEGNLGLLGRQMDAFVALLNALDHVRLLQDQRVDPLLPSVGKLNDLLYRMWAVQLARLRQFFPDGDERYYSRLGAYAAFLTGYGSDAKMRREGIGHYEEILQARRKSVEDGAPFEYLRRSLHPAMRGFALAARDQFGTDPDEALNWIHTARRFAHELRQDEGTNELLKRADGDRSANVLAVNMIECELTSAALEPDHPDRQQWMQRAAELLGLAHKYVKSKPIRADRTHLVQEGKKRLADLQSPPVVPQLPR